MADKVLKFAGDAILRELAGLILKDNGDGTYSVATAIAGAGGVPDGADVTEGALADAAITTNAAGSVSGKLRGIVANLATLLSRWPAALGQAAKAASIPVVIASDQEARKWESLGEQKIATDGAQAATLPVGCTIVAITAETAAVRYLENGTANANSFPVIVGSVHVIGPETLTSFTIFNAASSVAYLKYYKEE